MPFKVFILCGIEIGTGFSLPFFFWRCFTFLFLFGTASVLFLFGTVSFSLSFWHRLTFFSFLVQLFSFLSKKRKKMWGQGDLNSCCNHPKVESYQARLWPRCTSRRDILGLKRYLKDTSVPQRKSG